MSILSWIILAAISLCFSALFSCVETAYITQDRVHTGIEIKRGGLLGAIINRFYSSRQMFISTILVGNNIVLVIYGMGAAKLLEGWLQSISPNEGVMLLLSTLISTLVILFVGEFIPKSFSRSNPTLALKLLAAPVFLFYIVLWPVAWFVTWISNRLMRLAGVKSAEKGIGLLSIGELNSYIERTIDENADSGTQAAVQNEVKMFHNAIDFSKTQLRDCMVPRNEVVAVDIDDTPRARLSELFTQSGRSKIIVYREDIDNVLGYIHVSELFNPSADWTTRLKPVVFAPETLLANKMMRRMLQEKRSVAIVVDEFGGTAGIVTLEDLVEEIFGDIQDEHDSSDITAREISPGLYEFSGRIEVRTLNDSFRLDIPESDDYQTLAGYILQNTGELPPINETIEIGSYRFTILQRTATRIELVRLQSTPPADD